MRCSKCCRREEGGLLLDAERCRNEIAFTLLMHEQIERLGRMLHFEARREVSHSALGLTARPGLYATRRHLSDPWFDPALERTGAGHRFGCRIRPDARSSNTSPSLVLRSRGDHADDEDDGCGCRENIAAALDSFTRRWIRYPVR